MINLLANWTAAIVTIYLFIEAFLKLVEVLQRLSAKMPGRIKRALAYFVTLLVPFAIFNWRMFYVVALYSPRLSEPLFYWAMIGQVTLGAVAYALAWALWVYPRLRQLLAMSAPDKPVPAPKRKRDAVKQP